MNIIMRVVCGLVTACILAAGTYYCGLGKFRA